MFCSNCEADAVVVGKGDYVYKESGLDNVILKGIELITCKACGNVDPVIPKLQEIHKLIARAIVKKDHRLRGQEIRYLRKYLGLTAEKFAQILGTEKTGISKWENDVTPPSDQMDRFIRTVAMHIGDGLKKDAEQIVRDFPLIENKIGKGQYRADVGTSTVTYAS